MQVEDYKRVQNLAKNVHAQLGDRITASSTEHSMALDAARLLAELGASDPWFYNEPLETFPELWAPTNPALQLIKYLGNR